VGCLQENTVLAFAQARLDGEELERVEAHAGTCADCRTLLRDALVASSAGGTLATVRMGPTPVPVAPRWRPALEKGTVVGPYTVLELVGHGGMGEVYAAYDPRLDRRIALKLMRGDAAVRSRVGQERLLREAQAIAKLSHPNVVVVHDVGTYDDQVFVAMEYVEGQTLAAWLAERRRTWPEIRGVFLQAARGLSAAHRAGLVHRDFKPQNVMVTKDGTARVMDFGLARRMSGEATELESAPSGERSANDSTALTLTRTGERLGTPLYMAPEQFAGEVVDARTDQFGFCVALFEALYGVHPFGGSTFAELARNVAGGSVVSVAPGSAIPARVQAVLARGLQVARDDRWASMDELVGALESTAGRRRRVLTIAAVSALACIAIGGGVTREVIRRRDGPRWRMPRSFASATTLVCGAGSSMIVPTCESWRGASISPLPTRKLR
jgi:serine/threonine-protein kinase